MSDLETVFLDTQTLEQLAHQLKSAGIMEDAGGQHQNTSCEISQAQADKSKLILG